MRNTNVVTISGRLVRDVGGSKESFSYTTSGMCIARFSVAVNDTEKDAGGNYIDAVSFFDVTLFGKQAESLQPYLQKGQQVIIVGKLKQNTWEKDGVKHSKVVIIAERVELVGGKKSQSNNAPYISPNDLPKDDVPQDTTQNFPDDIPF